MNLNKYVDSSLRLDDTIAAMIFWQGLLCEENPFGSAFVSLEAAQQLGHYAYYANYMKGNRRN